MNSPVKNTKRRMIYLKRGEICISISDIFYTHISTCVSVCLYHSGTGIGGMTHISRSRSDDTTPSGRYLMNKGYYYADIAIEGLMKRFRKEHPHINERSIESFILGGIDSEGPVAETLEVLKNYRFKEIGADINNNLHRYIQFDTAAGTIAISRNKPFSERREKLFVAFSR